MLCYWAVQEMGESGPFVARLLAVTQSAGSIAVPRGRKVALEKGYRLEGREILIFLSTSLSGVSVEAAISALVSINKDIA